MLHALPQIVEFNESTIKNTDISFLKRYYNKPEHNYLYNDGEHYKLLTYISYQFSNIKILDLGAHIGASTLCLGQNVTNEVIGYDTDFHLIDWRNKIPNVHLKQFDVLYLSKKDIQSTQLIVLDISPHNGVQEEIILDKLLRYRYKGLLFCDDIIMNKEMIKFWKELPRYKANLTRYGHHSGSGIVSFNPYNIRFILK